MELFANAATSTLGSGINNSVTTLTVASASGFPSSGNFRIIIDSEIMLVTAVSGTTFTVTRGSESTTAASHSSGATVTAILTKGGLAQFRADSITSDVFANRPTVGTAGRLYYPTDGLGTFSYDDGSNWNSFGPVWKYIDPTTYSWSWENQGSATITTSGNVIVYASPAANGASARIKARPTPPYTITMQLGRMYHALSPGFAVMGFFIRDSSTGKSLVFGWMANGSNRNFVVSEFNPSSGTTGFTYASTDLYAQNYFNFPEPINWIQVADDNGGTSTSLTFSFSMDGVNFYPILQQNPTTWTASPDKVGFMIQNDATNNKPATMLIRSYQEH